MQVVIFVVSKICLQNTGFKEIIKVFLEATRLQIKAKEKKKKKKKKKKN